MLVNDEDHRSLELRQKFYTFRFFQNLLNPTVRRNYLELN